MVIFKILIDNQSDSYVNDRETKIKDKFYDEEEQIVNTSFEKLKNWSEK